MTYIGQTETEAANEALPPRDHNQPPPDQLIVEEFYDRLASIEGLNSRIAEIKAKKGTLPDVNDDDTAGRMSDLVKIVRAAIGRIDDIHGAVKAPYLAATRAVDDARRTLKDALIEVENEARAKLNAYVAQQARKKPAPIARGDLGARLGGTKEWIVEVVDVKKIPKKILMHPKIVEAIIAVVKAQAKAGVTQVPGIIMIETMRASIR